MDVMYKKTDENKYIVYDRNGNRKERTINGDVRNTLLMESRIELISKYIDKVDRRRRSCIDTLNNIDIYHKSIIPIYLVEVCAFIATLGVGMGLVGAGIVAPTILLSEVYVMHKKKNTEQKKDYYERELKEIHELKNDAQLALKYFQTISNPVNEKDNSEFRVVETKDYTPYWLENKFKNLGTSIIPRRKSKKLVK